VLPAKDHGRLKRRWIRLPEHHPTLNAKHASLARMCGAATLPLRCCGTSSQTMETIDHERRPIQWDYPAGTMAGLADGCRIRRLARALAQLGAK